MEAGVLFPNVTNPSERAELTRRLLEFEGRIPTLYTFFEDTKYLEPCATIMKALIPPGSKTPVQQAFRCCCTPCRQDGRAAIQINETEWKEVRANSYEAFGLGYRQLWLFTMSNFPHMHPINPRKNVGMPKPQYEMRDDLWPRFGRLSSEVGFDSPQVQRLQDQDSFDTIVRAFVQSARPRESFHCDPSALNEEVQHICQFLHGMQRRAVSQDVPSSVTDSTELPMSHRCRRPFELSFLSDNRFLYLGQIYRPSIHVAGDFISSFGVKRDVFIAFFGFMLLEECPASSEAPRLPRPSTQPASTPTPSAAGAAGERPNSSRENVPAEDDQHTAAPPNEILPSPQAGPAPLGVGERPTGAMTTTGSAQQGEDSDSFVSAPELSPAVSQSIVTEDPAQSARIVEAVATEPESEGDWRLPDFHS